MPAIYLFADGFGRWSATIADTGTIKSQRERARRAIAAEVRARENNPRPRILLAGTPELIEGARTWRERD